MLRVFLLLLIFSTSVVRADDNFLDFGDKEFAKLKTEESKWFVKSGLEYIAYRSMMPDYKGEHETFKEGQIHDVVGYGLGIGREFYFTNGFSSSFSIGLTYAKTLSREAGQAHPDIDLEVATTRKGHYITSIEAQGSLNYLFDFTVVDVQPFIEGSVGVGQAELEFQYQREPVDGTADDAEDYDVTSEENFTYTKVSLGLNLISYKGLTSYFKVTSALMIILDREIKGDSNVSGTNTVIDLDSKDNNLNETVTMTMASVGLGYMF